MKRPEILAPAGDFTCLEAAVRAGADAVYFGLDRFNMRSRSGVNFTVADLPEIARRCGSRVRRYLALNSIMFEGEAEAVEEIVAAAKGLVDAAIVADFGVLEICRRHGLPVHISTQMSLSNSAAVRALAAMGAVRVVLARECTLEEVRKIAVETGIEIECFVHGAQCVAVSGRCLMSQIVFGKSACRGECHQPCRRRFRIEAVDFHQDESGRPLHEARTAFEIEPHTVLSTRDLCSLGFVDRLIDAGIASFKIEGRARNAEYVHNTVLAYRRAVDAVFDGSYSPALVEQLMPLVTGVFHREFSCGMFYGRPGNDQFTKTENSLSDYIKLHVGRVEDYFVRAGIVQVLVQNQPLAVGDRVQIQGPSTGVVETVVAEMHRDDERPSRAERGEWVTFACGRCRVGDRVFKMVRRESGKEG